MKESDLLNSKLLARYMEISTNGASALRTGEAKAFTGFDTIPGDQYVVAQILKPSIRFEGLIREMQKIEKQSEASFLIADRDYPLHTTILQGEGACTDFADFINFSDSLWERWMELGEDEIFLGHQIIPAKDTVIIGSAIEPLWTRISRFAMSQRFINNKMSPKVPDIVHCSLCRLKKLPQNVETYLSLVGTVNEAIAIDPLVLEVDSIAVIRSKDLLL